MDISFHSDKDAIKKLDSFFIALTHKLTIEESLFKRVRLCFYELTTNAILHGNKQNEHLLVQCVIEMTESVLVLSVRDSGEGFDVSKIEDPTQEKNLKKIGGRGIFLIKNTCSECYYDSENKTAVVKFEM